MLSSRACADGEGSRSRANRFRDKFGVKRGSRVNVAIGPFDFEVPSGLRGSG